VGSEGLFKETDCARNADAGSGNLGAMTANFNLKGNFGSLDPTLDGCYAPTLLGLIVLAGGDRCDGLSVGG
jgi:hypothetical protein